MSVDRVIIIIYIPVSVVTIIIIIYILVTAAKVIIIIIIYTPVTVVIIIVYILNRLLMLLSHHKVHVGKLASYLIADYVCELQKVTLIPRVKVSF